MKVRTKEAKVRRIIVIFPVNEMGMIFFLGIAHERVGKSAKQKDETAKESIYQGSAWVITMSGASPTLHLSNPSKAATNLNDRLRARKNFIYLF